MKFVNGSAFLNHHFVKLGWLASWRDMIPADKQELVFTALEENLNNFSLKNGQLELIVPMAYIEGVKLKAEKTGSLTQSQKDAIYRLWNSEYPSQLRYNNTVEL